MEEQTVVAAGQQDEPADEMERLLRRCQRGDRQAWDGVLAAVRRWSLDLGRHKYRMMREDAEDLAQIVQLRVAQRLPQLRDLAAFRGWVRRLTHRAAVDTLRQRRPTISLDEPLTGSETLSDIRTLERFDQILLRTDLERALSRLPAHYREPIELHVLEGMPQDQIGALLGRPRNTVASHIERGLRRLRRSLSPASGN